MTDTAHLLVRGRRPAALAGVLAAAVGVGTAEVVAGLLPGGQSLLIAIGDAVIALVPGQVASVAIAVLGGANRIALVLGVVVGLAAAGSLVGLLAFRGRRLGVLGLVAVSALGAAVWITDPFTSATVALPAIVVGAGAAWALLWRFSTLVPRSATSVPAGATAPREPTDGGVGSRRAFLRLAGGATGGAALLAATGGLLQQRAGGEIAREATTLPAPRVALPPPAPGTSFAVDGLSPLLTPNSDFYRIDTALRVPNIDPDAHMIRVTGMVDRPFELSYAELLDLVDTEADVTLACVSNEVGGRLVGNARWLGVPLQRLLERAGVQVGATQIVGRAVDGWTGGFPVEAAFDGRPALVAVGMNGEPLPARHGFPVRLVISGLYGYVSDTKWLEEIELTTFEAFDAYWVPRGWAERAPIKTQSRIDVPRNRAEVETGSVVVAGVAWADERGIERVEVAVDDEWQEAELTDELAATSWRQWRLRWDAEPGEHTLAVRATGGDGETQTAELSPPRPDGATGHHTIRVTVT